MIRSLPRTVLHLLTTRHCYWRDLSVVGSPGHESTDLEASVLSRPALEHHCRQQHSSKAIIIIFNYFIKITPPRTSTSHLASNAKCRPPSAQPRTQLSMATCKGQRTMEATSGNGQALGLARDDDEQLLYPNR